ncbi:hypothetical protein DFH28DRAFT_1122175 [Melampsora americana]|nr:hypothetical protein DFH28DRAFT_1122175 [Melampsora americana]
MPTLNDAPSPALSSSGAPTANYRSPTSAISRTRPQSAFLMSSDGLPNPSWHARRPSHNDQQDDTSFNAQSFQSGTDHSFSISDLTDHVQTSSYPQPSLNRNLPSLQSSVSQHHPQHPSATAPRSTEAFKRLGQASLVSSSIFKSNPPVSVQPSPSPSILASDTISAPTTPRALHTPLRPQSQMAAALKGLGFASQTTSSITSQSPLASSSSKPGSFPASAPPTQPIRKTGTKRKSDENLPPPRPAPGLPPSAPSLHLIDTSTLSVPPKNRPPRKSSAYNALTRNALVTSSPFKAPSKMSIQSSDHQNPASASGTSNIRTKLPVAVSPPGSSSEEGEGSSNESEPTPGTPPSATPPSIPNTIPSPRSTTNSGSVLKNQRLGGPRSFTPPPQTSYDEENDVEDELSRSGRPPSAMSTPGKRRERRKTVTWGGEDVLEFEREEEWRRASGASSVDSHGSSHSNHSESEEESVEVPSSHLTHYQAPNATDVRDDEFWGRASDLSATQITHEHGQLVDTEDADQSATSVIVHELDETPSNYPEGEHVTSFSSEMDPVDKMVDALLTSPDLAGHVGNGLSLQQWAMPNVQDEAGRSPNDESLSLEERMKLEDAQAELQRQRDHPPTPTPLRPKSVSRFPYMSPRLGDKAVDPTPPGLPVTTEVEPSVKNASPAEPSSITSESSPFQPITLQGLDGADDSLFAEGSFVSSILQEPSFLGSSSDTALPTTGFMIPRSPGIPGLPVLPQSQNILSSTPRPSFSANPPSPQPVFPATLAAIPSQTSDLPEEHGSILSPPGSRRPLPRLPPSSGSPPLSMTETNGLPSTGQSSTALSALTAPAYSLPDIGVNSPFVMSKSEYNPCDSPNCSPGGRPRITREKIQERMRDRGATKSPEPELGQPTLTRDPVSQAASLHQLTTSGNHEESLESDPMMGAQNSCDLSLSAREGSLPEIPHEIPARPPLKARVATLSDSIIRPDLSHLGLVNDQTLKQEDMDAMSSGLDKLAHGFQTSSSELNSLRSLNHSVSFSSNGDESMDTISGQNTEQILPSKLVQIKGAGRRRRSLSTGGADIEETGTGAGAQAAVKSNSIKRTTPLSKRAQASSALLTHAVQRGMDNTEFQAPLDRALKKIMDDGQKTYRIQEADTVYASDTRTATVGKAGDVVDNRNWRKLRKVSDINEHEKQLKAFWAQNGNSSKIGKVFVKMSKLILTGLPVSTRPVWFEVIIDNGLHTAKTAAYKLEPEITLGVEFELVRAKKLEFSLVFNVPLNDPRNAHLRPRRPTQAPAAPPVIPDSPKRGLAKLFGGNARRNSKNVVERTTSASTVYSAPTFDPLYPYLDREGNLARALVNFDEFADDSLGTLKTVVIPCVAAAEDPVKAAMQMRRTFTGSIGQICMEFLSLPPLPKVPDAVLPNSSGECLKGLKIAEWWQEVWHTGVLSQMGADCQTWRRRTFKATGGSLFAYNDIMNKLSAEIRLAEVLRLEECGVAAPGSPDATSVVSSSISDQGEILPPFTFRLVFKDGSEVFFHADDLDGFTKWKRVLTQLIGKVHHLPVWAELLRLEIASRRASIAQERTSSHSSAAVGHSRQPGRSKAGGPSSESSNLVHGNSDQGSAITEAQSRPLSSARTAMSSTSDAKRAPPSASTSRQVMASDSRDSRMSRPSSSRHAPQPASQHRHQQHQPISGPSSRPIASTSSMAGTSSAISSSSSASNGQQQYPTPAVAIKRSMNRMDFSK